MTTNLLKSLLNRSTYSPENWERVLSLWQKNEPISFYSWECPPRQIQENSKFGRFVSFDIDINSVVNGVKLDSYTEIPRITTQPENEKWLVNSFVKTNPRASYTKIVADTNGLYIYKRSKEIFSAKKIKQLGEKFRQLLESKSKETIDPLFPTFVNFTTLQMPFLKLYDCYFNSVYTDLQSEKLKLVPPNIVAYWMDRMINHIGLNDDDKNERLDIMWRVIATYAAEGMIFELANLNGSLPNPVWINWEEKPESGKSTELLRESYGLTPIPKIYLVEK